MNKEKHKITKLNKKNFEHYVDCDYQTYYSCSDRASCDDGICRCGTISDIKIKKLPLACDIVDNNFSNYTILEKYCIERILSNNKFWNSNYWEVTVCSGYYGQEIGGVYFELSEKCDDLIKNLLLECRTDTQKIEFVLTLEYGYVLDKLKNLEWYVDIVRKEDIIFGQKDHYQKLDQEIVNHYRNYSLPRGICSKEENFYKIYDGYHRLSAGDDLVEIIIGQ